MTWWIAISFFHRFFIDHYVNDVDCMEETTDDCDDSWKMYCMGGEPWII